jgi:hypothetical protein
MTITYDLLAIHAIRDAVGRDLTPEQAKDTPTPVVAAPGWWLDEVAREMGQEEGMHPVSIHSCDVLREDSLDEPCMVAHTDKVYRVRQAVPKLGASGLEQTEDGPAARVLHLLRQSVES